MKYGIIDLGTNSIRVFVFESQPDLSPRLLYREKIMVRLGDGVFETHVLDPAARERTIEAFERFNSVLQKYRVKKTRCVATSALRMASDQEHFIAEVLHTSGLELEVISGEEEARLIAVGVTQNLELPDKPVVLIDMGGGSTEISLCRGKEILDSKSLPLGAARGQQVFLKSVPPAQSVKSINKLKKYVDQNLEEHFPVLPFKRAHLAIGSSGSIRAFGKIYESNTLHRMVFTRLFLKDAVNDLQEYDREELLKIPGLEERRVDLILSAGIILHRIMKYYRVHTIRVTKFALKDGILYEMIEKSSA